MRFSAFYRILALILVITIAIPISTVYELHAQGPKYYAIALPSEVPKDPKVAEGVIDLLIALNRFAGKHEIVAYWLLESLNVYNVSISAGSILVDASSPAISKILDLAHATGLPVYEIMSVPKVRAVMIAPPKIAVFDYGVTSTLMTVLKDLGFEYDLLPNKSIEKLLTESYDLLILPPGSGTLIAKSLGPGGAKIVAKFVYEGGGLIGICAGAYAVVKGYNEPTTWIQLVDAEVVNYPKWALGGGLVYVKIVNPTNPVMFGFKGVIKMIYWNGPVLRPYDLGNNTTLGIDVEAPTPLAIFIKPSEDPKEFIPGWGSLSYNYVKSVMENNYAITFSTYGLGKIVLFSTHPELTEGPSDTPKAKLGTRYNWRMLWQAIYFVAGKKVVLGRKVVGVWMWPSTLRYTYTMVLSRYYKNENLTVEKKIEAFRKACEIIAEELVSYGITDVFLEVKLSSGTLIFPSEVGKKYGVPNPYPAEPYNLTDVVKVFAETLHKYGIRLHAWMLIHRDRVWGKRDPIYHCGKWSNSVYKPPYPVTDRVRLFNETYQNYVAELARELVEKHGVDGIHLDYIRWPHVVYSFGPKDFELAKKFGIDLAKVHRYVIITYYGMPNESIQRQRDLIFKLYREGDPDVVRWIELRRMAVYNITKKIAEAVKSVKPDAILSAALMPDAADDYVYHMVHYAQRYEDFAELGYWLMPMAYHREYGRSVEWVKKVASFALNIAKKYGVPVIVGIQSYGVPYEEVMKAANIVREVGADGYCYFRFGTFISTYWSYARQEYEAELRALNETITLLFLITRATHVVVVGLSEISIKVSMLLENERWYRPYLPSIIGKISKILLSLSKDVAASTLEKIRLMFSIAKKLDPQNTHLYECLEYTLKDLVDKINKCKDVSKLSEILKKFMFEYSITVLTVKNVIETKQLISMVKALYQQIGSTMLLLLILTLIVR